MEVEHPATARLRVAPVRETGLNAGALVEERQRAERGGHALSLTSKELALLIFFLRHPCEVLTKARIYERVWNEPYDVSSNTVEVHLTELRRKLEAHGPRIIHTLRGRGYVLGDRPEEGK